MKHENSKNEWNKSRMKHDNSKSEWKKSFFIYMAYEKPALARTNINAK